MKAAGIDPEQMRDYVNGFRWGCPPVSQQLFIYRLLTHLYRNHQHGGGGVGLERVVMLFLKLGDVRYASLIPRDPRSFPRAGKDLTEMSMAAATHQIMHGPEATTYQEGIPHGDLPSLPDVRARHPLRWWLLTV